MRHQILGTVLSVSLLMAPAFAENVAVDTAATDPDQKIKCRRVEVTGSLLKKEKCVARSLNGGASWKVATGLHAPLSKRARNRRTEYVSVRAKERALQALSRTKSLTGTGVVSGVSPFRSAIRASTSISPAL